MPVALVVHRVSLADLLRRVRDVAIVQAGGEISAVSLLIVRLQMLEVDNEGSGWLWIVVISI